ncbi:hypothetical protein BKA59DRAFT_510973 [Fusarium tricinctum]|uniref:Uncharacterized protein n=1 Tax=Fusarium tricinctum TaxID=61284 RepID=A0A8K0RUL1_9HYPO|nr:hypothetical protein BKA59DRAFT_510973 [Fusarium tricinctum]
MSGRSGPVAQIENILGPTLTTVPVHVQMDRKDSVTELPERIQQQSNDMMPYEHTGLQTIARPTELWPSVRCFPLVLACVVDTEGSTKLHVHFDTGVIGRRQIKAICCQYEHIVAQRVARPTSPISNVSLCGSKYVEQIMMWNAQNVPKLIFACVEDLIGEQAKLHREKVAIDS